MPIQPYHFQADLNWCDGTLHKLLVGLNCRTLIDGSYYLIIRQLELIAKKKAVPLHSVSPLIIKQGDFFGVFLSMYFIQHCCICRPSDSTVSEDAGIEPRTVATSALAVRRSIH